MGRDCMHTCLLILEEMVVVRLTVFFDGLLNDVCWYTKFEFEHVLIGMSISFFHCCVCCGSNLMVVCENK